MDQLPSLHVCPVFREITPIITPVLDPTFRPSKVILLSSPHLTEEVADIKLTFTSLKIDVEVCELTDEWHPDNLERKLDAIIAAHPTHEVMLNVSSGTTTLCIKAARHFMDRGLAVYHVNPENDRVNWIHPPGKADFELQERLDLKHYFIAHGIDKISMQTEEATVPLPKCFFDIASRFGQLAYSNSSVLNLLNRYASAATRDDNGKTFSVNYPSNLDVYKRTLECAVKPLIANGLARFEGKKLVFTSLEAKAFACGGWLEIYAQSQVEKLKRTNPMIRDIQRGVTIRKIVDGEELSREIDVALLSDNRLYMIECKTGGVRLEIAEVLTKLETLRTFLNDDRAGIMLITLNDVTSTLKKRADDYNIRICTGRFLQDLCNVLNYWIRKGHD